MPQDMSYALLDSYGFKLDHVFGLIMPTAPAKPSIHDSFSLPMKRGYGLNDDKSWITHNGVNLLWLPPEYRPNDHSLFAMSATTAAIGCSSGRILFLTFSASLGVSVESEASKTGVISLQ
jgi:hypothetical protein